MKSDATKDIAALFADGTAIDEAIKQAVHEAFLRHKREQRPIVVEREGEVVWVRPEDIDAENGG